MNYNSLKLELEKRAKVLIAKRDGQEKEVDEDDEEFGSDTDDEIPSARGMSTAQIKAELARRLALHKARK